ncbi:MAG: hypothetical protein GWN99_20290 [Gemmatimonadetes bacterium]|nr:hypothetical protein [Gemmatimonadota bacterium]NIS03362.1 hypothetical protein [Gemmatimonadota bacterium]NIT69226.1 hypothetical protein [Gemmatimonadota bacterium]NIV25701.1 hypothetical protein [Gemmatimonadota bacterium]NIW77827.1 hypothetical protein [Gemmatimonadota bacterium]
MDSHGSGVRGFAARASIVAVGGVVLLYLLLHLAEALLPVFAGLRLGVALLTAAVGLGGPRIADQANERWA